MEKESPNSAKFKSSFAWLGFLLGHLTAISASPIAPVVATTLVGIIGAGGFLAVTQLSEASSKSLVTALRPFCALFFAGLYAGLVVLALANEYFPSFTEAASNPFVRSSDFEPSALEAIIQRYDRGRISAEEAMELIDDL